MSTIEVIFIMLALVLLSYVVKTFVGKIAVPLIQIALGCIYTLLPFGESLEMETEIFMLIFIAPILFMDGKKFKNKEFLDFQKPILYLVLGLVLFNVIVVGYVINLLLGIALPMAIALAAVLSPTDAVAVKAISGNIKLPHSVSTIVEGESMLNDATGLVAFNFAIIAQMTGHVAMGDLAVSFVYIAFGGLLLGVAAAYAFSFCAKVLRAKGINEPAFFTLIQILLPFVVFLAAEWLGFSGILAVVACGRAFAMFSPKLMTLAEANIRISSRGTWHTLLFILNGLVFVLLGMELPFIFEGALAAGFNLLHGSIYVVLITLLLMTTRFIWVYLFIDSKEIDRGKNAILISLSGVRGALTLAVCLSIPFILNESQVFVERSLLLFISSGVIILSIVIANIFLPLIMRNSKASLSKEGAEKAVIKASLKSIEEARTKRNGKTVELLKRYLLFLLADLEHKDRKD